MKKLNMRPAIEGLVARMKLERKARRISQLEISRSLDVTMNTITFWETGKTKPTRRNRARIEQWLRGKNFVNLRSELSAFARRLKIKRLKRRLTLSQMSRHTGISITTLYNWENGISKPSEVNEQSLREWEMDNPLMED